MVPCFAAAGSSLAAQAFTSSPSGFPGTNGPALNLGHMIYGQYASRGARRQSAAAVLQMAPSDTIPFERYACRAPLSKSFLRVTAMQLN